ncbi:MAG: Crp/Fnr family transcriptional regulator [Mariniphaga sp.]
MGIKDILENPNSIFYLLSREEKEEFERHISLTHYKKNEIVFRDNDKPNGLMVLVNGKVKIYKEGVSGREQIIRMACPLEMIGYRAIFAGENHIATAVTIEESMICTISTEFIHEKALKNIHFCQRMVHKLSKELGFAHARTVSLAQKHIRGRLAESLMLLKNKYGFENDGVTLKVYLSRDDIANLSNMTTSNAIRTLSTFANEKIISIDGRKIKILDAQRLDRVSKLG